MKTFQRILILAAIAGILVAAESPPRIAVINTYEIEDMIRIRVLAKPENAEAKAAIVAADEQMRALHEKMQAEESRDAARKESQAIHQTKHAAEQLVASQVQAELIKVVKEVSKDRYSVVLDADYVSEGIVTKNVEMVDITIDVKEHLLVR